MKILSQKGQMTRAGASKNKADNDQLKEIADSIGVGVGGKNKQNPPTGCQRGKPIDALTRRRLVMRILLQKKGDSYRVLYWSVARLHQDHQTQTDCRSTRNRARSRWRWCTGDRVDLQGVG